MPRKSPYPKTVILEANLLRAVMASRNLLVDTVAARAGIAPGYLSQIRCGRTCTDDVAWRIALALGEDGPDLVLSPAPPPTDEPAPEPPRPADPSTVEGLRTLLANANRAGDHYLASIAKALLHRAQAQAASTAPAATEGVDDLAADSK